MTRCHVWPSVRPSIHLNVSDSVYQIHLRVTISDIIIGYLHKMSMAYMNIQIDTLRIWGIPCEM